MQQLLKFALTCAIATSWFLFAACGDGDPGPTGAQGDKGDKGAQGDKGDTGANGESYAELTQYGTIRVQYRGWDINNNEFNKIIDFKYAPVGPDVAWTSRAWPYDHGDGDTGSEFQVYRFDSGNINENFDSNNHVRFFFSKPDNNNEFMLEFGSRVMIPAGASSFSMNLDSTFPASETVYDYVFLSATGELKFGFDGVIFADDKSNNTGHDIVLDADVNVKIFQSIDTPK